MAKTTFKFYELPHITKYLKLESDDDIDENSLMNLVPGEARKTKRGEINVVFLNLTAGEWKELGIRDSLWGQSRVINGVVYCYGRWNERSDYQRSHRFDPPVRNMKELTIGLAHEASHGINNIKNQEDLTHAYFYGFEEKKKYPKGEEPSRYQVKPDAIAGMDYALELGEIVNFYCIRTKDITKEWEDTIRDVSHIINDQDNVETARIYKKYETALQKLSKVITRAEKYLSKNATKAKNYVKEGNELGLKPLVYRKQEAFLAELKQVLGYNARVTSGFRSFAQQQVEYDKGRKTGGKIVTYAEPGESFHNYGVAIDIVERYMGYDIEWEKVGEIGKKHGFEWGGDWSAKYRDRPHFQYTGGYKLKDFQNGNINQEVFK